MSAAGGCYRAVEIARRAGCDCVQVFTKNNNQWRAKELSADDVRLFQQGLAEHGIAHPIAHDSYLINLAAPDEELWRKSIEAFRIELLRAEQLGIPYVVTHPGAFTTSSEEVGLARVIAALDEVHAQTRGIAAQCLLENTAGQGSCLGCRFEHLATILDGVKDPERLGVCIDTCHTFAAGYPLGTKKEYQATMRSLDKTVGLTMVKAFHLNDSKRELGSRVDRHEHIGQGKLGLEPFRLLLNDRRFRRIPMYLETPKGKEGSIELDVVNLATLRGLIGRTEPVISS
jgi:deoxyribonuclease-4